MARLRGYAARDGWMLGWLTWANDTLKAATTCQRRQVNCPELLYYYLGVPLLPDDNVPSCGCQMLQTTLAVNDGSYISAVLRFSYLLRSLQA